MFGDLLKVDSYQIEPRYESFRLQRNVRDGSDKLEGAVGVA